MLPYLRLSKKAKKVNILEITVKTTLQVNSRTSLIHRFIYCINAVPVAYPSMQTSHLPSFRI